MYELTCPACKHAVHRPFLRVGALASCTSCAHRFTIQREHIKSLAKVAADTGAEADNPLLIDGVIGKPAPPHRAVSRPQASAGDASADAQSDDRQQVKANLKPLQPVVEHQEPSEDVARVIARHRARRQRRGKLIFALVLVGLAFFGFIGAIITHMASKDLSFGQALVSVFGGEVQRSSQVSGISQLVGELVVVPSTPIMPTFWQEVQEIHDGASSQSKVKLTNVGMKKRTAQASVLTADVQTSGQDVIEQADLHLKLVDRNNRVFAQNKVTMVLLSGHKSSAQRRPISVPVPKRLADRAARVVSHVEPTRFLQGGAMFNKVIYERVGEGPETSLVITAYNPLGTPMQRAVFYVRAFDDAGITLARWRVEWNHRIDPRQRVEFATITGVQPQWNVAAWEVIGAGGLNLGGSGGGSGGNSGGR